MYLATLPEDRLEQRGLPRPVRADEGGDLAAPDVGVHPIEDRRAALPDGEVPDRERVEMTVFLHGRESASERVTRFRRIASS